MVGVGAVVLVGVAVGVLVGVGEGVTVTVGVELGVIDALGVEAEGELLGAGAASGSSLEQALSVRLARRSGAATRMRRAERIERRFVMASL